MSSFCQSNVLCRTKVYKQVRARCGKARRDMSCLHAVRPKLEIFIRVARTNENGEPRSQSFKFLQSFKFDFCRENAVARPLYQPQSSRGFRNVVLFQRNSRQIELSYSMPRTPDSRAPVSLLNDSTRDLRRLIIYECTVQSIVMSMNLFALISRCHATR